MDDNFYSQMAASLADNSFDESSDEDLKVNQTETTQLAKSVDVDDMDASLFSSLSSGPSKRRGSRQKTRAPKAEASTVGTSKTSESVKVVQPEKQHHVEPKKDPPKATAEKKEPAFEFEDDILDILSDGDEQVDLKKRVKPTIKLANSKQEEPPKPDGNPITSTNDEILTGLDFESPVTSWGIPQKEIERPGTSRGIPSKTPAPTNRNAVSKESTTPQPVKEGGAEVLKMDVPAPPKRTNDSKPAVTFDDDDDILGGLGLDDKPPPKAKVAAPSSRLDDLLGVNKQSKPVAKLSTKSRPSVTEQEAKTTGTDDDDNVQFGGYVPSSVETSGGPSKRGRLKLPSGRRRGSAELESMTARPSTAPSPVRKSVHFAENLESSERPASSASAATESRRSSLKGQKTDDDAVSRTAEKKPPQPVRLNKSAEHEPEVESQPTLKLDDSLFGADSSAPKQTSSSQGRRRPTSNAVADLFDDPSSEDPIQDEFSVSTSTRQPFKSAIGDTENLDHPVFPWQKSRSNAPKPAPPSRRQNGLTPTSESTIEPPQPPPQRPHSTDTSEPTLQQNAMFASFQEQLLQQQKSLQDQLAGFQAQSSSALAAAKATSQTEVERLQSEVKTGLERVKELEGIVVKKDAEISEKQKSLEALQEQFASSNETRQHLEEQSKETGSKLIAVDKEMAQLKQELNSQVDDLKMKLYKVELERDHLQHTIESMKTRHSEEIESMQKSHDSRLSAMEESMQRRETRWKEETASDTLRFQEKLSLLEQEKTDAILALKKKLDALEISKTNEIGRLKDLHYSAVEDLKREHDLDKQHLLNLHRQELEAVKAASSHTRMLSDLSHKVEASTKDMAHLQAKLEQTHSSELDERMKRVVSHEEHLKTLEDQLIRQKTVNSSERDQLQGLVAKMESHVSQQKKQLEQERWQLQQDMAKLNAQQTAFEEERASTLMKLETERERIEQAKQKILTEQQEILSKCYEDRRSIASDRAELSVLQKKALEREQREKQLSLQSETEREALSAQLRKENSRLMTEKTKLKQELEQLQIDRETVDRDKKKLEAYGAEIQQRSLEIEQITETVMLVREKGEQSLAESEKMQGELSQQAQAIQIQREDLVEREKLLAIEQLSLAQERRKLQHLKVMSLSTPLPDTHSGEAADKSNSLLVTSNVVEPQESLRSVSTASLSSYKGDASTNRSSYSPRASPLRVSALSSKPSNVKSLLSRIDQSRSLRHLALDAKKDDEYLERETNFIHSLQSNTYVYS